jgi:hypothetical protein
MKGVHVMNKILEAALAVGGAAIALFAGDKVFNKKETKSNNEEVIDATTTSETTATTETNTETSDEITEE